MKAITLTSYANLPFAASELNSAFNVRSSFRPKNGCINNQNSAQFPCQGSNLPLPM
jgi:hypothetical protein